MVQPLYPNYLKSSINHKMVTFIFSISSWSMSLSALFVVLRPAFLLSLIYVDFKDLDGYYTSFDAPTLGLTEYTLGPTAFLPWCPEALYPP